MYQRNPVHRIRASGVLKSAREEYTRLAVSLMPLLSSYSTHVRVIGIHYEEEALEKH